MSNIRVGLVGEDAAHALLLSQLSNKALVTHLGVDVLQRREFIGDVSDSQELKVPRFDTRDATTRLKQRTRQKYLSHRIGGLPAGIADNTISAIKLIYLDTSPDVLLVLVDEDGEKDWALLFPRLQEYAVETWGDTVILGLCVPTAEGWLVPMVGQGCKERSAKLKSELGFDPVTDPHRLCSKPKDKAHHAKRVLHALLSEWEGMAMEFPASTPNIRDTLPALEAGFVVQPLERLGECGLGGFVAALKEKYLPRFG